MIQGHRIVQLRSDSHQVGQQCPIKRMDFRAGDRVVICEQKDEAVSIEAYQEGYSCPHCGVPLASKVTTNPVILEPPTQKPKSPPHPEGPPARPPIPAPIRTARRVWAAVLGAGLLVCIGAALLATNPWGTPSPTATWPASSTSSVSGDTATSPTRSNVPAPTSGQQKIDQPSPTRSLPPATPQQGSAPTRSLPVSPTSSQAAGRVTTDGLALRTGPGTEYDPPIRRLAQGDTVTIIGYNTAKDGAIWRQVRTERGEMGWVASIYLAESGCIQCVALVPRPSLPLPATPLPRPISPLASIASNREGLLNQGQNGWTFQYEQGRNSGNFAALPNRRSYDGADCYVSPREDYVRLCANGEIHPGQESRLAYRWESSYNGAAVVRIHAHKMDTRCGDGVWVGTYVGERNRPPSPLEPFSISAGDNTGTTKDYRVQLSTDLYVLVMLDIRGSAECDLTRLFIDLDFEQPPSDS